MKATDDYKPTGPSRELQSYIKTALHAKDPKNKTTTKSPWSFSVTADTHIGWIGPDSGVLETQLELKKWIKAGAVFGLIVGDFGGGIRDRRGNPSDSHRPSAK